MNKKICIVDDDKKLVSLLTKYLRKNGFTSVCSVEAADLINMREIEYDLIILDIMMPDIDGFEVCKSIRKKSDTYIIFLSAKSDSIDKVVGLEIGADDYMTKPFGIHELLARISAVLRRSKKQKNKDKGLFQEPFMFGEFEVNPKTYKLYKQGKTIDLSERELKLICHFHDCPGEVLSRDKILNAIWGIDYLGTTRTLDQHIAQLRKKIEVDPSNPCLITTVHGVGYRYEA